MPFYLRLFYILYLIEENNLFYYNWSPFIFQVNGRDQKEIFLFLFGKL